MKKGTHSLMPINVGVNVDDCSLIEFIFVQDGVKKKFSFPSDKVAKTGAQEVSIDWTAQDKVVLTAGECRMDTRITFKGSVHQPETAITRFIVNPTLFPEVANA